MHNIILDDKCEHYGNSECSEHINMGECKQWSVREMGGGQQF